MFLRLFRCLCVLIYIKTTVVGILLNFGISLSLRWWTLSCRYLCPLSLVLIVGLGPSQIQGNSQSYLLTGWAEFLPLLWWWTSPRAKCGSLGCMKSWKCTYGELLQMFYLPKVSLVNLPMLRWGVLFVTCLMNRLSTYLLFVPLLSHFGVAVSGVWELTHLALPPFMISLIFSSLLHLPRSLLCAKRKTSYFFELFYVMLSGSREIFLFLKVLL